MKNSNRCLTSNISRSHLSVLTLLLYLVTFLLNPQYSNASPNREGDTHYTKAGFFDIHVCNWPDRPLFFMILFSTAEYESIKKIEIFDNNGKLLGNLDLTKYRTVMLKKPVREKRVFIKQFEIPKISGDGWYSAKVHLKSGKIVTAKDYVIISKLNIASGAQPGRGIINEVPKAFTWKAVPNAQYYQVFVTDYWNDNTVHSSDLLTRPEYVPPKDLLKRGGAYCWRIHARDTNEHVLLGDFNHGSLSRCVEFEIQQ